MNRLAFVLLVVFSSGVAAAQSIGPAAVLEAPLTTAFLARGDPPTLGTAEVPTPDLMPAASLPRMSAELALTTYQQRSGRQAQALAGYSAATVIRAELPKRAQQGEFELERHFTAPRTLTFRALRYVGDGFVKTNVIARLLQSEVDHVQKDDPAVTAIRPENYKFSLKGATQIDGRRVYVYQIKPRKKRAGLLKGHIYLDAYSGSLVRVEGRVVKSPSLFVKKIDFVQDYADVSGFTFPVRTHSEAKATLVGRTVVDIVNRDYQPVFAPPDPMTSAAN